MKQQVLNPYLPNFEYIPDGEPRVFDGRLYIYGSHDRFGGDMYCLNDYVTYSAPVEDLSDWRYEGVIYKKTQDPFNRDGKYNMFAPDVVQGEDGQFYLYYGVDFESQISVARSSSPAGPFEFYGYVQHPTGERYGRKAGDPFQFDLGVLVDDDGRVYLYTGFAPKQEVIDAVKEIMDVELGPIGNHVVELASDMLTLVTAPKQLIPNIWDGQHTSFEGHEFFEASSIRKFNGRYYFIYSSILSHELAYAVSDSPTEGFEFGGTLHSNGDVGINAQTQPTNYWGNNHGSVVNVDGQYYVFGHRQTNYTEFSRQGVAEKLEMDEHGQFKQAEMTCCGLNDGPLNGTGTYPASMACYLMSGSGAKKSIEVSEEERFIHPCFTQQEDDHSTIETQYIHNLCNGAVAGYKYFDLNAPKSIELEIRGSEGTVMISTDEAGEHVVASVDCSSTKEWKTITADFEKEVTGKTALFVRYIGSESIDFLSFTLKQ